MRIGTFYTGTVEEMNGQSIKTKYFMLGIPLFPTSSFYTVKDDRGIKLPVVSKSAWFGAGRTICPIFGVALLFVAVAMPSYNNMFLHILAVIGAIVFCGLSMYAWIGGRVIPEQEKKARMILEKTIGYNMLPHRLPMETRMQLMKTVSSQFVARYEVNQIEPVFNKATFNRDELPLLYCMALYVESVNSNKATELFLTRYPADSILM